MWYWIVMALLVLGSAALLGGTFMSIKKNKAQASVKRGKSRRRDAYDDSGEEDYDYDDEPEDEDYYDRRRAAARRGAPERERRQEPAQRQRQRKRRQWKIIMEDLDTWEKYSFIFYDSVGIGRAKTDSAYERYMSLSGDGRVSKSHCAIVHRGEKLYLVDEGSRNGTYLNGVRIEKPMVIQKEDVIGAGETKLEVLKILRESD